MGHPAEPDLGSAHHLGARLARLRRSRGHTEGSAPSLFADLSLGLLAAKEAIGPEGSAMICNICDSTEFEATEYRAQTYRAPAFECRKCGAICLCEDAARTEEERTSVRLVIAKRASISESGEHSPSTRSTMRPRLALGRN